MKTFEEKWAEAGDFFAAAAAKQSATPRVRPADGRHASLDDETVALLRSCGTPLGDNVCVTVRTTLDDIVPVAVHGDGSLHTATGEDIITLSEIETSVGLAYTVTCSAWTEAIVVPASAWDRLRISALLHRIRRAEHNHAYYSTPKDFEAVDECLSAMIDNDIVNHTGIFAPWSGAGAVSVAYRIPLSREEFHALDDIIALAKSINFDAHPTISARSPRPSSSQSAASTSACATSMHGLSTCCLSISITQSLRQTRMRADINKTIT